MKEEPLKERIKEATTEAILKILSKYYINFSFQELKSIYDTSEEKIKELGYEIVSGYIQLKQE